MRKLKKVAAVGMQGTGSRRLGPPCSPVSLEREKEIRRRLFTSSINLAIIRHFQVVVVQGQ